MDRCETELNSDVFRSGGILLLGFPNFPEDRFRCSGGMPSPGTPAEFITAVLCEICEDIAFRCVQAGPFSVNTEYIQCPFNHLCLIYEQKKICTSITIFLNF